MHIEDQLATIIRELNDLKKQVAKLSSAHGEGKAKDIIDIKEAAEYLTVSTSTLYTMTSRQTIPFFRRKDFKKIYFSKKILDAWRMDNN